MDLEVDKCPIASENFIKVCKTKFYTNALFVDVQKNYVAKVRHLKKDSTSFKKLVGLGESPFFPDEIQLD